MSPIRVLPRQLAARIAAGEVVERPASAVKELVENALDAGATRVSVELSGGGLALIRVTDNGRGIPHADTAFLFQRHATSKLDPSDSLESIATLGFRGEALYSIASVAEVAILTRALGEESGTSVEPRVHIAGDSLLREPRGAPQGTTVTVRRLFAAVPARRKFMRSPQAEASRVQTLLALYALAFPEVAFSLTHDEREMLATSGTGDLREAFRAVYGAEMATSMLAVHWPELQRPTPDGSVAVQGLASPPEVNRANRSYITMLVNRRPVQSRSLVAAVEQAYVGMLPQGRHPIAVLNVLAPYGDVDVNVHPAKSEVRFRDESAAFSAVQRAVRAALTAGAPAPSVSAGLSPMPALPVATEDRELFAALDGPDPARGENGLGVPGATRAGGESAARGLRPPTRWDRQAYGKSDQPVSNPTASPPLLPREAFPLLNVLGQTQNTYIVAEGPGGIYLVDQHAAHERVHYERLREAVLRDAVETQALLGPEPVELSPQQLAVVEQLGELLARYGWRLDDFGAQTRLVRAMPALLVKRGATRALRDLLDAAASETAMPTWEEKLAATLACHGSVRAGQTLTNAEMTELLSMLNGCRDPNTCPHGRPTMVHLSAAQLEREFKRR
ncbi:MAG: DNA mismatch repair endonuclease MutL [Dehalococcoidia bacterium]|nr:DNA mismatch repair endonuclease MutL [Dehalococcoidia bacterium]